MSACSRSNRSPEFYYMYNSKLVETQEAVKMVYLTRRRFSRQGKFWLSMNCKKRTNQIISIVLPLKEAATLREVTDVNNGVTQYTVQVQ